MQPSLNQRNWFIRAAVSATVIGLLGVSIVMAEDIWVNSPSVDIKAGKDSIDPVVATVEQGAKLTVLQRDSDNWIKVNCNGQEGWVYNDGLSPQQVGTNQFAAFGSSNSSGTSEAAAARGWGPDDYAKVKGFNPEPLNHLLAQVRVPKPPTPPSPELLVSSQALKQFQTDGKIGKFRAQQAKP